MRFSPYYEAGVMRRSESRDGGLIIEADMVQPVWLEFVDIESFVLKF